MFRVHLVPDVFIHEKNIRDSLENIKKKKITRNNDIEK